MAVNPEVSFILSSIDSNYGSALADVPLERVDRDNSENIDTGERLMAEKGSRVNLVGATLAETQSEAIGTEYDTRVERTVNVRLSGQHHTQHGHVDPSGANGAVWRTMKNNVRRAILTDRAFPSVSNRANTDYTWIEERNENDLSSQFKDEFRFEADYVFIGFEDLPSI